MEQFSTDFTHVNELISYGSYSGSEVIIDMILQKKVSNPNGRKIPPQERDVLMSDVYRYCGIGVSKHPVYGKVIVITFARYWIE